MIVLKVTVNSPVFALLPTKQRVPALTFQLILMNMRTLRQPQGGIVFSDLSLKGSIEKRIDKRA